MSNIELYEALKGSIPEQAARLIAAALHPSEEPATARALVEAEHRLTEQILRLETKLETRMERLHSSTLRWMLGLFVPVWAATWGTLLVALLRG